MNYNISLIKFLIFNFEVYIFKEIGVERGRSFCKQVINDKHFWTLYILT